MVRDGAESWIKPEMNGRERFEQLALPHLAAAYTLARWLVRSPADAEDIVQEAYLRAYRSFAGFDGGDIKPWLLTIVRNAALRWLHERKRAGNIISFDDAASRRGGDVLQDKSGICDRPGPEAVLIAAGERALVGAALADLAPLFREVLVLREIEALSYREIAAITGTPIGTVMSRLSRGRAALREILLTRRKKDEPDVM